MFKKCFLPLHPSLFYLNVFHACTVNPETLKQLVMVVITNSKQVINTVFQQFHQGIPKDTHLK